MLNGIDGFDAFQHVFNGVLHRVLSQLDGQTLVAHVLQGDDLRLDLLLGEFFPGDVLIFQMVGAVNTAVDAVVGKVEGGEHNDAVAIEVQLDLPGQVLHFLHLFGNVTGQKHRCLPVGKPRAGEAVFGSLGSGLFQKAVDQGNIALVFLGITDGFQNFLVGNEFFGFHGFGIVSCHFLCPLSIF